MKERKITNKSDDNSFKTALELYKESKKNTIGRPKGSKKETIVLLDYRSWIIEADSGFPRNNYVVRKKSDGKYKHVAYCSNLEDALKIIFNFMILDNVNRKNVYGGRFKDLCNVIVETKSEFSSLLDVSLVIKNKIKREKNETP